MGATWTQQAYLKASNPGEDDLFGVAVDIDGDLIAVGAFGESSNAAGINGDETDDSAPLAGAVYVFVRRLGTLWSQEAYIKASNAEADDWFGGALALSGHTLAVAASGEASAATGVGGDESDNTSPVAGAVYVFVRSGAVWTQEAYIKASTTEANDRLGALSLAIDGDTLAVSCEEDGASAGVGGDQTDNTAVDAGAVFVFTRTGTSWSQAAYVKASNTDAGDLFGTGVSVSSGTIVVGAWAEASVATGINGDETDNSTTAAGAVYEIR